MTTGLPTGSVVVWPGYGSAVPSGWKLCDGSSLDVAHYAALYAVIGNIYGGDGSHFNLPDYRGYFLRGVATDSGRDPDMSTRVPAPGSDGTPGAVGSTQGDQVQTHRHQLPLISMQWYADLPEPHHVRGGNIAEGGHDIGLWSYQTAAEYDAMPTGGTETRPKNIYTYYVIKCE